MHPAHLQYMNEQAARGAFEALRRREEQDRREAETLARIRAEAAARRRRTVLLCDVAQQASMSLPAVRSDRGGRGVSVAPPPSSSSLDG